MKKLVLKKNAPDEVEITVGMEYSRKFKRENEPFSVDKKDALMLLESFDYFAEFEETKTASETETVKTQPKDAAKK